MRSLIESLHQHACRIDWKWIGAMFAFYMAVVVIAAGLLMTHRSTKGSTSSCRWLGRLRVLCACRRLIGWIMIRPYGMIR